MSSPSELVRDFLNTCDLESDTDELSSPAELAVWLRERGLVAAEDRAADEDLATALALREGLRAALRGEAAPLPPLPLVVTPGPALAHALEEETAGRTLAFEPVEAGVRAGLARIAARAAHADWERLKVCAALSCQWAFIDSSKNRSRSWCSMKICGNRLKTRTYRTRRQVERRAQGPITDTV